MELHKDRAATLFVDRIKPNREYLMNLRAGASAICKILESQTDYEIGHERISISMSNKMVLQSADCDLFIYVNGVEFEDWGDQAQKVADSFEKVLTSNGFFVVKGEFMIQVGYNGVVYDIAPSMNVSPKGETEASREEWKKKMIITVGQVESGGTFTSYKSDGYPPPPFTSAFIDDNGMIIKFTAWLAKYWDSHTLLQEYVGARSTIMELVAVYANSGIVTYTDKTVLRCFKRFLCTMLQFNNLEIILSTFYNEADVPSVVRQHRPVIMDPVCPYRNLGWLSANVISTFKEKAEATLVKLVEFEGSAKFEFDVVFKPSAQESDYLKFLLS